MLKLLWRLLLSTFALAATPSATDVAAKWKQRSAAAAPDYAKGVAQTDKDPTALAIAAGPRYIQNVTARFNDGTWANGLRRAGKAGWQAAVASKGENNYSNGVNNAEEKVAQAFGPLLSFIDGAKAKIAAMPNVTDVDRENRMLTFVRTMRTYKKS